MNVTLISNTENPLRVIATAAKTCYAPGTVAKMWESLEGSEEEQSLFVAKLQSMGHMSPFEHASFTFGIDEISRACSHQLVRHRIASFSQQSQRYVAYNHIGVHNFVYPLDEKLEEEYDEDIFGCFDNAYFNACKAYEEIMDYLINMVGMSEKEAAENARYVLPNGMHTNLVMTMNCRQLFHFFNVRCCNRAQEEIRTLAWTMLRLLQEKFPALFDNCGPSCLNDRCKEGSMSCGKPYQRGIFEGN